MQNMHKLRKRIAEKSAEAEMFKNKYGNALAENLKLKEELLKANKKKSFGIPFVEETKHELFCVEHAEVGKKAIEEASTNFSSRFMPNVKFRAPVEFSLFSDVLDLNEAYHYYKTNDEGDFFVACENLEIYSACENQEVHYLEAVPELVPEGMVYDKESDSLIENLGYGVSKAEPFFGWVDNLSNAKEQKSKTRFMPNVKLCVKENGKLFKSLCLPISVSYIRTGFDGNIDGLCDHIEDYYKWQYSKEVSIYEFAPELVPEGMVYDEESDSLVEKEKIILSKNVSTDSLISSMLFKTENHGEWAERNVSLDEVAFINAQIKEDPEAWEAFMSKLARRNKSLVLSDEDKTKYWILQLQKKYGFTYNQIAHFVEILSADVVEDMLSVCKSCNINPTSLKKD